MSNTVKVKVWVKTDAVGSKVEKSVDTHMTKEEWKEMDEGEKNNFMFDEAWPLIEWDWTECESA